MSLLPLTVAVQRLETEGLLESRPQVGTRVRIPSEQDVRERFIIREALESQSARMFAERATMAQRHELLLMAENLRTGFVWRTFMANPEARRGMELAGFRNNKG